MRIEQEITLDFKDVLIRPKRSTLSSRKDVDLFRKLRFKNYLNPETVSYDFDGIPIMASNMDGVGTIQVANALSKECIFTCLVKTYEDQQLIDYFGSHNDRRTEYTAMSIGITEKDYNKFKRVYSHTDVNIKYVCIDVANGYSQTFVEFVKKFRIEFPNIIIIAGNVVTGEMTEELILSGADIVKVGIGPGSVCTTRIQTGVGYPQLSAIIECADAAHGLGGHVIADGGCSTSGDISKAYAAGADFVMLGGMLAGTDQGGGNIISKLYKTGEVYIDDLGIQTDQLIEKKFVQFYGMSSQTANDKHFGGLKDYRTSEGRTVLISYKGDINTVLQEILGGVRSTCTYVGASSIKELPKRATFIRCNDTHNRVFEQNTIGK